MRCEMAFDGAVQLDLVVRAIKTVALIRDEEYATGMPRSFNGATMLSVGFDDPTLAATPSGGLTGAT